MAVANAPMAGNVGQQNIAALGQAFQSLTPDEISGMKALSNALEKFSPDKLKALLEGIQFVMDNKNNYAGAVKVLLKKGMVEPGDLPPNYIAPYFSILKSLVTDALSKATKAVKQPAQFAKGGIASLKPMANALQKAGTGQDKILAHINPQEAGLLQRMKGGGVNPHTGLAEFGLFDDIGGFLKSAAGIILPVALNFVAPGLGWAASAAIGSGISTLINGGSAGDALQSAVLGGVIGAGASGVSSMLGGGTFMQGLTNSLPGGILGSTAGMASADLTNTALNNGGGAGAAFKGAQGIAPTVSGPGGVNWTNAAVLGGAGALASGLANSSLTPKTAAATSTNATQFHVPTEAEQAAMKYRGPLDSSAWRDPYSNINVMVPTPSPAYPNTQQPPMSLFQQPVMAAHGGQIDEVDARVGGHLRGPGTGTSDSIPAKLSDGEFVMTAKAVKGAGGGDREKGAAKMYELMHQFEGKR